MTEKSQREQNYDWFMECWRFGKDVDITILLNMVDSYVEDGMTNEEALKHVFTMMRTVCD